MDGAAIFAIRWPMMQKSFAERLGTIAAQSIRVGAKPYDLRERSFVFARDVVAFSRLVANGGYILRRLAGQLADAAGSVGANLEEGAAGQTKPDFICKQCIALKESREARFWLRLIAVSEPSFTARAQPLIAEASEFVAILTASIETAKPNPGRRGAE